MFDLDFDDAYFVAGMDGVQAYIPLLKLDSMYTVKTYNDFWNVVFVTSSSKEYIVDTFDTLEKAENFCEKQLFELSNYMRAVAQG